MNHFLETAKKHLESKTAHSVVMAAAAVLALIVAFEAGVGTGYHRARLTNSVSNGYSRVFTDPHAHSMLDVDDFDAHGAAGQIVSIQLPTLIVADRDGTEKTVRITDDTLIRRFRDTVEPAGLSIGDAVIVIGMPSDNATEVEAKLIRLLPPPNTKVPMPGVPLISEPQ